MVLSALLMAMVAEGLRYSGDVRTRVYRVDSQTVETMAARRVLEQVIGAAYPAFISTDYSNRALTFNGGPAEISLTARLPDAIEQDLMAEQQFYVARAGKTTALFWAWRLDLPSALTGDPLPKHRVELLGDVRGLSLTYFGIISGEDKPAWHNAWSHTSTLPELVRVHVDRTISELPRLSDIYVQPRISTNSECRYDPTTIKCLRL